MHLLFYKCDWISPALTVDNGIFVWNGTDVLCTMSPCNLLLLFLTLFFVVVVVEVYGVLEVVLGLRWYDVAVIYASRIKLQLIGEREREKERLRVEGWFSCNVGSNFGDLDVSCYLSTFWMILQLNGQRARERFQRNTSGGHGTTHNLQSLCASQIVIACVCGDGYCTAILFENLLSSYTL